MKENYVKKLEDICDCGCCLFCVVWNSNSDPLHSGYWEDRIKDRQSKQSTGNEGED